MAEVVFPESSLDNWLRSAILVHCCLSALLRFWGVTIPDNTSRKPISLLRNSPWSRKKGISSRLPGIISARLLAITPAFEDKSAGGTVQS